ncbi:MAG: leucine-rich repeat protein [Bacteroidaceae bacterium]|nr:leucine-rich repeat protein [Bacteroidaceae bacterium]
MRQLLVLLVAAAGSVCSYADTFTVDGIEYVTEYSSTVNVAPSSAVNQALAGAVTIPDAIEYDGSTYTVTRVGSQAFKDNMKITSVTVGNNVAAIDESAFQGCMNLTSATFGTGLVRIDNLAFQGCTALTAIAFPEGFKYFGRSAFAGSGLNGDIVLPGSLTNVGEQAFAWTSIKSVTLRSNAEIKAGAFDYCQDITDYYFSPAVLKPVLYSNSSYGSPMTVNDGTKIHVSQATLSMLENNWYTSSPLQNYYNGAPSTFVAYGSTEGALIMKQISVADTNGGDAGSLALCFTITGTDAAHPTAALYCPPATGYNAEDLLKTGANAVIKNDLSAEGRLEIPATVTDRDGTTYTVNVIGAGAFGEYATTYYNNIAGLKFPTTLTHIGVQAFRYLQGLKGNLIIPASVQQIGHPDVPKADLFYSDNYGEVKVPGVYMMHTTANGIDWYETEAYNYFAYNYSGTQTSLNVCQEIYDKAYGYNGAEMYPKTSAFWSWHYPKNWLGNSNQVKLFDPASLGLAWTTAQTVVDISGEYDAPELVNPFELPVTYSSSNPAVATIDADGNITLGTAEGTTTLTATFAGNDEYDGPAYAETVIIRRGEPMLAEDQENHNPYNTCQALTKVTRWTPTPELYMENYMWGMPHMMDGNFYVSAFWQSNNSYEQSEWFYWENPQYLQLCYTPAFISPNYGLYYDEVGHDQQPGNTVGSFICFKVKGPGTIIVRGYTESDNAKMGICVQGNVPMLFSGTEDREIAYDYTLDAEEEAYAYVYGASLSPNGRHGYIRYIKFIPEGTVMADVSVGGIAIEEESDDVLGDGGSIGFEWREDENGGDIGGGDEPAGVKKYIGGEDGDMPIGPSRYPVLILNNATLISENGPAIEVNSHDRFLIELRGQNTIQSLNGNAAISMGTLQSEDWGGGTISIVGLDDEASLTIPSSEGVENGIYLAESALYMENFDGDISGTSYGVHFQGYDQNDWNSCTMNFGKGMTLKMRGGEAALSGFNPQSMNNLGYYDEEKEEWTEYVLLESDMEYPDIIWGDRGGSYGTQIWVDDVDPENPEGYGEGYFKILPAKYLHFGVRPESIDISIGSFGMTTFCSTQPLNFTDVDGVKAYVASEFDAEDGTLTMTQVYEVPERTGIVICGAEGTYSVPVEMNYEYYENLLVGCTVDTYIQPEENIYTNFVLSRQPSEDFLGFYRFTTSNPMGRLLEAGKAYLQIETEQLSNETGAKGFRMAFDDDETTGIKDLKDLKDSKDLIYNLSGQRIQKLQKGINIVNGKKILK